MANAENVRVVSSGLYDEIYLGLVTKAKPDCLKEKRGAKDEVLSAVVDYCMKNSPKGSYIDLKSNDNEWVRLTVQPITEEERNNPD